jgi:hypothetical protein
MPFSSALGAHFRGPVFGFSREVVMKKQETILRTRFSSKNRLNLWFCEFRLLRPRLRFANLILGFVEAQKKET